MTTLVLAHPSEVAASAVESLLRASRLRVVRCGATLGDVLNAVTTHRPEIILASEDIAGQDIAGFVLRLKSRNPGSSIVLMFEDIDHARLSDSLNANVSGLIFQNSVVDRLVECVQTAASGQHWFDPKLLASLHWDSSNSGRLTARELQISKLVTHGFRNKQIAMQMAISEATVKMHLHHVYEKLRLSNRTELAGYVFRNDGSAGTLIAIERLNCAAGK